VDIRMVRSDSGTGKKAFADFTSIRFVFFFPPPKKRRKKEVNKANAWN